MTSNRDKFIAHFDEEFDVEWIKDNFMEDYGEEIKELEEKKGDIDYGAYFDNFVEGYYWGDLLNKVFLYEPPIDMQQIKYLQYNDIGDYHGYFIDFMNDNENICYIREKLIKLVVIIKLTEIYP